MKTAKRLREILKAEGLGGGAPGCDPDELAARADGDLRMAINELQLRACGRAALKKPGLPTKAAGLGSEASDSGASSSREPAGPSAGGGDTRISGVHLIGKLLHGPKHEASSEGGSAGAVKPSAPPWAASSKRGKGTAAAAAAALAPGGWDPEALLGQCDMGVDTVALFLQHNCVEFYSDVGDLWRGLDTLSDTDLFIGRMFNSSTVRVSE